MLESILHLSNFLLGLIVGVATNMFSWWVLFHYFVPVVEFSPYIQKTITNSDLNPSGSRYRIKLENVGKRTVIDVEVTAKVLILGLGESKKLWVGIPIPLTYFGDFIYKFHTVQPAIKGKSGKRKVLALELNSRADILEQYFFPESLKQIIKKKELTLEDLLSQGSQSFVRFYLYGYDKFSGTRKQFMSKKYTLSDIKTGTFDLTGLGILEDVALNINNENAHLEDINVK